MDDLKRTRLMYKVGIFCFFIVAAVSFFNLLRYWGISDITARLLGIVWTFFYAFLIYFFMDSLKSLPTPMKTPNKEDLEDIFNTVKNG